VHKLHPGDINVMGAMADSVAAAIGAASVNLLQEQIENRGLSFAIGEEKEGPPRHFTEEGTNRLHHPDCLSHVEIYISILLSEEAG
jgi:hypothetical protein